MADIDLKTETPDTSLPTTGFLFGADSQAASAPSVFTTQAVATTLLGSTTLSGATITADAPVLNMSQTWNAGAVTFTGLKFNVTDTASASGSLLVDLQAGGTSQFFIKKNGYSFVNAIQGSLYYGYTDTVTARNDTTSSRNYAFDGTSVRLRTGGHFGFTSGDAAGSGDTFLTRRAAANLRFGAADAAAPVAQTLSVQSVVAGTSNTAGANLTITGSQGTGTGAGGSIIFQVAPAGSSGTAQNALATALTIGSDSTYTFVNSPIFSWNAGGSTYLTFRNNQTNVASIDYNFGLKLLSGSSLGFTSASTASTAADVILLRDNTGILALRNGTNNQQLRVYGSFTSASVYDRLTLKSSSTVATVAAETDAGDMDLALTPAGSGNVQFGTHAAIAAETVTGYITIKDAGGTLRKLAVVS